MSNYLPIFGATAWTRDSFPTPESFTLDLTCAQIFDMGQTCAALESKGVQFDDTGREDFPLPNWTSLIEQVNQELKSGRGFVLIRGLPFASWSEDRCRLASWGLGTHFGEHVSQTIEGQRICDVRDTTKGEASPRQFKTNRELSLHTDPVSDLIGLACIRPAKSGGESVLTSAVTVYNQMLQQAPEELDQLFGGFYVHRFGEGRADDAPVTSERVPVLSFSAGDLNCRYVRPTIVAGHKERGTPLTPSQIAALDRFDRLARDPSNTVSFRLDAGDLVLVNNLSVLHARTEFIDDDEPSLARHLLRLWLEAPAGFREVLPVLNYFNRGRCGIPVQAGKQAHYDMTQLTEADGIRAVAARI